MSESKHGKYIIRQPIVKGRWFPSIHVCGFEECAGFSGFPVDLQIETIKETYIMEEKTHVHLDADELLFFLGGNPQNFFEFDAEIEFYMGKEKEKHLIDTPAIVFIPSGLPHNPLIYKRVSKPLIFCHLLLAPKYFRTIEGKTIYIRNHKERAQYYSPEEIKILRLKSNH
ncbi:MAG: hypothetical protein QXU81_08320 [Candidatus Bathyarchaeia archaeon]